MGANSEISWTHHTFNPWWGCVKVSPGCQHCYADTLAHRYGFDVWGPAKTTARRMMSENYWKQPLKWNREAERSGERKRVFCASMADVFEEHPQVTEARVRLFNLIMDTPWLDWLLLTKRPENINRMIPMSLSGSPLPDWHRNPPENVWYGASVENQEQADKRIPELLKVSAKVRFLSCEPLLGPVDLTTNGYLSSGWTGAAFPGVSWVICGGESGPGARPMHPQWAQSLRDQCQAAGVPYHFKQWGEYAPRPWNNPNPKPALALGADGRSVYAQVAHVMGFREADEVCMERVGKHAAGRLLDGVEWNEFPA